MSHIYRFSLLLCLAAMFAGPVAASEKVTFKGEALWPKPQPISVTGILSKPKGDGPFPAVVILPNCGGPRTHEFAKLWPAYLNKLGYITLNVDPFTPRKAKRCTKQFKPSFKVIAQDAYGALSYLAGLPYVDKGRVGLMGSSMGAGAINWLVGFGKTTPGGLTFGGAVSLYAPSCKAVRPSAKMLPTLIILGDKEVGVASCRKLPKVNRLDVHILPGVYHGFDQPTATRRKNGQLRQDLFGNKRLYSAAATRKAQELVKDYFTRLLSVAAEPASITAPSPTARLPMVGNKNPYVAVQRRDSDGDNKVSKAEWDKSPGLFSKLDADGDGFITAQEFYDRWKSLQ